MIKRKTLIIVIIVLVMLSLIGLLIYNSFFKEDNYIDGMIRVIEKDCNGREVTTDEYNRLNSKGIMFYPFNAVLQNADYYKNDKCALYFKYKKEEIDKYSGELNADLNDVIYYQESYLPSEGSILKGLFQIEVRDYRDYSDCSNAYNEKYEKIYEYYQKLLADGYKSDFGSYEKYSPGIITDDHCILFCEYQKNSNNIWGEILVQNDNYYTYIKYSFEDCDDYYEDLCRILDYMNIPYPKDIELN